MGVQGGEISLFDAVAVQTDFHRKFQHGPLARADVGLAVVDRDLVGHQRLLLVNPQYRPVRHHAVQALVSRAGGGDDHLAFALGQAGFGAQHERVVVRKKRPPLGRAARQHQKNIGHKARFLLHLHNLLANVLGQGVQVGQGVAGHKGILLGQVFRKLWGHRVKKFDGITVTKIRRRGNVHSPIRALNG